MDPYDRWFADHVLPLEGRLTAYLRRAWSNAADVDDLRQEVYVRVYEACRARKPASPGNFLFAVARNLLTDRLRRQRVVTIDLVADLEALNVSSDEIPIDRVLSGREELRRLERAMAALPPRCAEIFRLRKIEGLSQRETAGRLGLSESTVEKQTAKAMLVLAAAFFGDAGGERGRRELDSQWVRDDDEIGNAG